jgi:hypothetical protein
VTVSDTLGVGVTLVSMTGDGWTCVSNTCTRFDSLAPGASYPPITVVVNVDTNAPLHGTDEIAVSGGGSATAAATDSSFIGSMAHLAIGGGWDTTLTLMNVNPSSTQTHLDFYDEGGVPMPVVVTSSAASGTATGASWLQTLPGNALAVLTTAAPASQDVLTGSARLFTSGSLDGFAIFRDQASGQQATVPLEAHDAAAYTLAFDNTGVLVTGVALANVSDQPADIPVVLRGEDGVTFGADTLHVPAEGHASFVLNAKYPATALRRGTLQLGTPSGGRISALGLRVNGGAVTTIPTLASSAPGGGTFTHIAASGGWQTTLTLVNLEPGPVHARLGFHDNNGAALTLPLTLVRSGDVTTAAALDFTLAGAETLTLLAGDTDSSAVLTGSATLTADGVVSGYGIFRNAGTGQEAVVPIEDRSAGKYFLAFDSTNDLITGLAVANSSLAAAAIPVTLRDDAGAVLDTIPLNLAAQGHASFLLSDLSKTAAGKRGTLEFDVPAGGLISALGLRFTPAGVFTSIPSVAR